MKKKLLMVSAFLMSAMLLCTAACGVGKNQGNIPEDPPKGEEPSTPSETLGKAKKLAGFDGKVQPLSYAERTSEEFLTLKDSAEHFAATFTEAASTTYTKGDNFTVSPLSVYMALSLAAETAAGETKEEILSALGTDDNRLRRDYAALYRSLEAEYRTSEMDGNKLVGCVDLSNSVWVNDNVPAKQACLDILADDFYCTSYSADFTYDNENANRAVREFIKEQTRSLIDKDFALPKETLFALINTLYLKDVWNTFGADLGFTADSRAFTNADGTVTQENLLMGQYVGGRKVETDRYSHFYTQTANGYKLKFILPKEGYTVKELCTAEVLSEVNAVTEYNGTDEEQKIRYNTRCLFPEFTASYDEDVRSILNESFGIEALFDPILCDLSAMTDKDAFCSRVQHVTKLHVDKTGVEGAAVTVIMNEATSTPPVYTDVYEDFLVDRAFVFILTDRYDTTLFSGIVNRV